MFFLFHRNQTQRSSHQIRRKAAKNEEFIQKNYVSWFLQDIADSYKDLCDTTTGATLQWPKWVKEKNTSIHVLASAPTELVDALLEVFKCAKYSTGANSPINSGISPIDQERIARAIHALVVRINTAYNSKPPSPEIETALGHALAAIENRETHTITHPALAAMRRKANAILARNPAYKAKHRTFDVLIQEASALTHDQDRVVAALNAKLAQHEVQYQALPAHEANRISIAVIEERLAQI